MSEIKGQLLGMLLVVAVFGAVATILYSAFTTSAQNVATKISEEPTFQKKANLTLNSDLGSLTY